MKVKIIEFGFRVKVLVSLLLCSLSGYSEAPVDPLTVTATAGTTGPTPYSTLREAFVAINNGIHTGAITILINASTTETASAILNASGSGLASYSSIIIKPTTTALTISGNLTAPLIDLSGADNVTIDGRVNATGDTRSLRISNTSTSSTTGTSTIRFIADASNNAVKYCTLTGSSTNSGAGIVFFSTGTTTGNDNNIIEYNDITNEGGNRPLNAVYALGSASGNNENNIIRNNNFYDFLNASNHSYGINIYSYNSTYTIADNSFYATTTFNPTLNWSSSAIFISAATGSGNGFTLSGNYIGGSAAQCGGSPWTNTGENNPFTAISVLTAAGTANEIQGNTIQKISWTNTGISPFNFTVISLSGSTVANIGTATGNIIGASTGNGSIQFTSASTSVNFFGIQLTTSVSVDCRNNTIGSITTSNASTNATNIYGINISTSGTVDCRNNIVGSTTTAGSIQASSTATSHSQFVFGIRSAGTLGTATIMGNTVANLVNATNSTNSSLNGFTIGIVAAQTSINNISGNIVRDLSAASNNTSLSNNASVTGIVMISTATAAQTVSGNTVYNLSNSYPSFSGCVTGIYFRGTSTPNTVRGNFIHSLSVLGASSTSAKLFGIKIDAGATTFSNNIVSLGGNTTTDVYGIYQTGAESNNNNLYFNTVYISGALASGTNTSYAIYSTGTSNIRDYRNNVLLNARSTSSGTNLHYALYIDASGGTLTCDYNNYFVSGEGGVLGYFAANQTALPIVTGATGDDAHSIATNPIFVGLGTTASEYAPTVPATGVTGTGISTDYLGSNRDATFTTMGAIDGKSWIGGTSSAWTATSNWTLGTLPASGNIIYIPSGRSNYPELSSDGTYASIALSSGASLNLSSNTLTLTSNLSNAGSITGTGKVVMGGSSAQSISGTGTISNIEVNNSTGVTIASGAGNMLSVTGVLTPTLGTLTTNGNLRLKSNASGTARVAAGSSSGGYVSGNVTVERYIPAGRKWRFLCTPLKGASNNSVFYNWQNNDLPNGMTGVEIWGPGGDADPSLSNSGLAIGANASMRYYNAGWQNVTNTNTTYLFDATTNYGYALFQTGPYNNGSTTYIGSSSNLPTGLATTLSATGSLITGDHTKNFTAATAGQYFLVANPYASPVDPNSFTGANISNLGSTLYMWDAKQAGVNSLGRYVSYSIPGTTYSNGGSGTGYPDNTQIQSGQAFFVRAPATGPASLVFKETSKSTTGSHAMFGNSTSSAGKTVRLFLQEDSCHIDGAVAFFRSGASAGIDAEDGVKLMNSSDNLGFRRDGRTLVFEFRPEIKNADTLYTQLSQMQQRSFRLRVALLGFTADEGLKAELVDRYLKRRTLLSFTDTTDVDFMATADSATSGERFLLVFTKSASNGSGTAEPTEVFKMNPYPNPVVQDLPVRVDLDGKRAPWNMQLIDVAGRTVWKETVKDEAQTQVRIDMSSVASGVYQLLMTDGKGQRTVSRIVKN